MIGRKLSFREERDAGDEQREGQLRKGPWVHRSMGASAAREV